MSAMLREAGLLKELAKANERIRQLEAERVPEGYVLIKKSLLSETIERVNFSITGWESHVNALMDTLAAAPAQEKDNRPTNCRNRLSDEGKPYPRSGCAHCKTGGITGCPFKKENSNG